MSAKPPAIRHVLVTFKVCKRLRQLEYEYKKEFASEDVGPGLKFKNPADYLNAMEKKCFSNGGPGGNNESRQIETVQIF